ncbi:pirin family protein [Paraburkholderia oxyphila]|uniref:pirin family protein n=1 Tax=Paraburkholderia oxyphila TaxID=614212 RepID=UPI0005BE3F85|nr:pirin family protein [Paraburkholderia oxyphila]
MSTSSPQQFSKHRDSSESRPVVFRHGGKLHGPVTRIVSPSDLGQILKPFVFLDRFDIPASLGNGFKIHPHSGIATVTIMLGGSVEYSDTTGKSGLLDSGSVEWMNAGGGVWHDAHPVGSENVVGYQLWVALPPEIENAPATSQYLSGEHVSTCGPAYIVLGEYAGVRSTLLSPDGMNYLRVTLRSGERWTYDTPSGHTVGWVFAHSGTLNVSGTSLHQELAIFQESDGALEFEAQGDTEFILGSAVKHPHDLWLGYYSVHTSAEALARGEAGIRKIGAQLELTPRA